MSQLYGQIKNIDGTTTFKPLRATPLADGGYALAVDTELTLDGANISITNLKVGSTDQTSANSTYLKTLADGTVAVSGTFTSALGVPQHYNGNANIASATVNFAGTTKSILIINSDVTNDLLVSFDSGANTTTIPSGEDISLDTAVTSLDISALANGTPYQILTTE